MGKIKLWHMHVVITLVFVLIVIESILAGRYILSAANFLALIINAYAAYYIRKYGD
jgi:hypothetical protein